MSITNKAAIVGIGDTPTDRLGSKPGEPRKSSAEYLSWAMHLALEDTGLSLKDFQGQGLGVTIPTAYPQPFWPEEVSEILGITPGFLLGGATGGAGAVSLIGGMSAAINAGFIDLALVIGAAAPFSEHWGGGIQPGDMRDWEIPYGTMGPNSKIAMVMRRHMYQYGTTLDHLGKIAVAGRYHASLNPLGYLRKPITIDDDKNSRLVADPVRLLDCVMPANGGKAYILASPERAKTLRKKPIWVKGFGERSLGARVQADADPFDRIALERSDRLGSASRLDRQELDVGLLRRIVKELGRTHRGASDIRRQDAALEIAEQHCVDQLGLAARELGDQRERHAVVLQALDQVVDAQRLLNIGDAVPVEPRLVGLDARDHVRAPLREARDPLLQFVAHRDSFSQRRMRLAIRRQLALTSTILRRAA